MSVRASISTLRAAAGTCLLALMLGVSQPALAFEPIGTAFTYQGELAAAGAPAAGTFDLQFRLFDAAGGGVQIGSTLCSNDVVIENGRFAVSLDFGAAFAGAKRFLEIEVRQDAGEDCSDASGYAALSPRQEMTAAPSASFAQSAASLNGQSPGFYQNATNLTGTLPSSLLSGTYTGPLSLTNVSNVFTGNGAAITNLNATNIASGALDAARMPSNWAAGGDLTGSYPNPTIKPGAVTLQHLSSDVASTLGTRGTALSVASRLSIDATLESLATDGGTVCAIDPAANMLLAYSAPNPIMPQVWPIGNATTGDGPRSVAVAGQFAYVVCTGSQTLQAYDLYAPMGPAPMGTASVAADPVAVVVSGSYAYVASGSGALVQVFDLTNPTQPAWVLDVVTAQWPVSMETEGTNLFVLCSGSNLLQVFDISMPMSPALTGSVATAFGSRVVAASGLHAFVLSENTLEVFDVANPVLPSLTGAANTDPMATSLAITDRYAFVVSQMGPSVSMYDVSDPAAPFMVTSEYASGAPTGMVSTGGVVVVAGIYPGTLSCYRATTTTTYDTGRAQFAGQVRASEFRGSGAQLFGLNATNITSGTLSPERMPPIDASLIVSGVLDAARIPAIDAASIGGGTLDNQHTTGTDSNVPNTLVLRDGSGSFTAGVITADLNGNAATADTALMAAGLGGHEPAFYTDAGNLSAGTLDNARTTGQSISTPDSLVLRDQFGNFEAGTITATLNGSATTAQSAAVAGDAALLAGAPPSFYRDAGNLVGRLGSGQLSGTYSNALNLSNASNALAGDGAAIRNLDASSLTRGVLDPSRLPGSWPAGGDLTGSLPNPSIALGVVTRSKLASDLGAAIGSVGVNLSLLSTSQTSVRTPVCMATSGSYAVVATHYNINYEAMAYVYDISNPAAPVLVSVIRTDLFPIAIVMSGPYAYIASGFTGSIQIIDITNPALPVLLNPIGQYLGYPTCLATSGGLLYAGTAGSLVQVYNINNPAAIGFAGQFPIGGSAQAIATSGSFLSVTTSNNLLQVFNVANPSAAVLLGQAPAVNVAPSLAMTENAIFVPGSSAQNLSAYRFRADAPLALAGSVSVGSAPSSIAISSGFAYVSTAVGTLRVVNISDPANLSIAGGTQTGFGGNQSVAINGTNVLHTAGDYSTFNIFQPTMTARYDQASTTFNGAISASSLSGSGAGLSNLNASNITTGTLANARTTGTNLNTASALVMRDTAGNFSAGTITAALNGNAATATAATTATTATTATNATQLNGQAASFYTNASNINTGTLPMAQVPNLDTAKITSGTFSDLRLSSNIPLKNAPNAFTSTGTSSFAGNVGIGTTAPIQNLDVSGRVNIGSGVIQRGGTAITSTSDLGLYSQLAGNFMRFVTNNGEFHWYADGGAGSADRMVLFPNGNLSVSGSLAKAGGSFKIDHPLDPKNKYLYHSFVESPDMMNVYNGNITTDGNGYATITMPDYFEALNRDFRYQLTVLDPATFALVRVSRELSDNAFEIASNMPNIKVSWQITGIRRDAWAEKNRIPNSVEKVGDEKGKYLHPEAFDQPLEKNGSMAPAASGH